MELVFLGAFGAVPIPESGNVSILVRGEAWSILVDTSGNPVQSLLKAGTDPLLLDCVTLTHAHTDHLYALPSLIHTLWMLKRKKELVFLAGPEVLEKAKQLLSFFNLLSRPGLFPMRFLSGDGSLPLSKGAELRLFPVSHSVPTWGFVLSDAGYLLAYSADTAPSIAQPEAPGRADALIHEASGTLEEEASLNASGHSSARQAALIAGELGAKRLFLCHAPARAGIENILVEEAKCTFSKGSVVFPKPFHPYRLCP